jgi:membrane protein required for colicin V production
MEPHSGLNTLDYAVLGVILASGLFALMRGFVREMFSLGAWIGAYFCAVKYYPLAEPTVAHYVKNEKAVGIISAVAVFCVALIVLAIIGNLIAGLLIRGRGLTAVDRSLGFLFGIVRGVLVVSIAYLASVAMLWPDINKPPDEQAKDRNIPPALLMEAKTRPAMDYGAGRLKEFVPQKEIEKLTPNYFEEKTSVQHTIQEQTLENLSTPSIAVTKPIAAPAYDDKNRSGLDQLINQKGKP